MIMLIIFLVTLQQFFCGIFLIYNAGSIYIRVGIEMVGTLQMSSPITSADVNLVVFTVESKMNSTYCK